MADETYYDRVAVNSGNISWKEYKKVASQRAIRINGPFTVRTREGTLTCPDGYLAIDAHGWPHPIAKDEFEKIYVEIE